MDGMPFGGICKLWREKIQKATEYKRTVFDSVAEECFKFYDGPADWMYNQSGSSGATGMYVEMQPPKTTFRMSVNKIADAVSIFVPAIYHRNPNRTVTTRKPELPDLVFSQLSMNPMASQQVAMQDKMQRDIDDARSQLQQWVLNYICNEFNYTSESRPALVEALVKGRGVRWTELYQPPGSEIVLPRSSYDSVDNFIVDPDADRLEDAMWIARKCRHATWKVEQEYGLPPGTIKGQMESLHQQAYVDSSAKNPHDRVTGKTYDTVEYWKIWSKMGFGHHLSGGKETETLTEVLDSFGDNVFLVVCRDVPYPLNFPPQLLDLPLDPMQPEGQQNTETILNAIRWPIPFHEDRSWPVTPLDFHEVPGCVWPQAHFKPSLGYLRWINWAMSFLMGKIRVTCRDFICIAEDAADEFVNTIEQGDDLSVIRFKRQAAKDIKELVQQIQMAPMNGDIWKVIEAVFHEFDKASGLTELAYGLSSRQMRSAEEATIKGNQVSIRPDDMAERVELWETRIARKEALALRWFSGPRQVSPIFGEEYNPEPPPIEGPPIPDPMTGQMMPGPMMPGMPIIGPFTDIWAKHVYVPLNYQDRSTIEKVVMEFNYRVEAGSIRKPNQDRDVQNMDQAIQVMFQPLLAAYQMTGDPSQVNAIVSDWCKARDLNPKPYLFPPFNPAPTPLPGSSSEENQQDSGTSEQEHQPVAGQGSGVGPVSFPMMM